MGLEIVNKNKNCVFNGPYAGRDLYITMLEDTEREFVVTHNVNIRPVSYFTGRETELQELRQRIEEGRKLLLVSGMGGIGKTHICRKLFEEYLNKHAADEDGSFQHIGYIEYNGDMGSSLQNCLKFKHQDSPEQNQEAAWRELEYLAADGKLLLFVDNVDKPISADVGLQRLKGIPGAVILTSRQVSVGDEFELYRIGFLGMEQCKEIYEKIRFEGRRKKVDPEEVPDLEYVVESLAGRHTITVEHLAYLARTKLWKVKKLREELEKKGFQLTFRKNGELVNIQESYEKLYDLSELTEAEQNILEAFSVFPYIPLAADTCNKWLLLDAGVTEDDDILMGLYQKGWLQFDWERESYAMHPVFSQFIYEKCKPKDENHSGLINICCRNLILRDDILGECRKFIPFAENIIVKMDMKNVKNKALYMGVLADSMNYIAEYSKAQIWYYEFLRIYIDILGESNPDVALTYNNLAVSYIEQGEYNLAENILIKSLEIYRHENRNFDVIVTYINLARVAQEQGKCEKAKELFKQIMDICKSEHIEENRFAITLYNNLAVSYIEQGEYNTAEKIMKQSLTIYEAEQSGGFKKGTIYNNLAYLYSQKGEYEKAEKLYKMSLYIDETALGEKHPSVAITYNNLALVHQKKGEYEKAEELLKKSLGNMLGERHPNIVSFYNNLAILYLEQKEYGKTLEMFLKIYRFLLLKLEIKGWDIQMLLDFMETIYNKFNQENNFEQWLEEQMKE